MRQFQQKRSQQQQGMIGWQIIRVHDLIVRKERPLRLGTSGTEPTDHFAVDRQERQPGRCQRLFPLGPIGVLNGHAVGCVPDDGCASQPTAGLHQRDIVFGAEHLEGNALDAEPVAKAALSCILERAPVLGAERPASRFGKNAQNGQSVAVGVGCDGKGEIVFQPQIFRQQNEDFSRHRPLHRRQPPQFGLTTKLVKPPLRSPVPLIASLTADSG